MLLALLLSRALPAAAPGEYQVEAVFLLHFTQFVEWPQESFGGPHAPFVIGVLGRDPFGPALDAAVRGETTADGRPLVIERYTGAADIRPCQILFIDRSAAHEAHQALQGLAHAATLTVSDVDLPDPRDLVIRFLNEERRIRLRINIDSARSAGLTISSKLLRPSEVVGAAVKE